MLGNPIWDRTPKKRQLLGKKQEVVVRGLCALWSRSEGLPWGSIPLKEVLKFEINFKNVTPKETKR